MALYQEAERFINAQFWERSHDPRSTLDIEKIVADALVADNKAKDPQYYGHREGIVHVTSLTKCLRGVVHEMLKTEKDRELDTRKLGVFKAGNLFEDYIVNTLGNRVVHTQREYEYRYKNIVLVGRSDFTILDEGVMRIGENKSVHSDSFWYRDKEGTLVSWQNQVQLQVYMWLEYILNGNNWGGMFTYISKDDVTVKGAPIKFNRAIIDEVVIPALDIINEAYTKRDPMLAPIPEPIVYCEPKHQWQKNFIATYCDYHCSCAGAGWVIEAETEVKRKNKELKEAVDNMPHLKPKPKKTISVV